jgi:hypothetical protein
VEISKIPLIPSDNRLGLHRFDEPMKIIDQRDGTPVRFSASATRPNFADENAVQRKKCSSLNRLTGVFVRSAKLVAVV